MSFGALPQGFRKKTEAEIIADLESKARSSQYFGSEVDLSVYSPLGVLIRIFASALAENWNGLESNYFASFLDTAEGFELDRLGIFIGSARKQALPETVTLLATGSDYTVIPSGFLVQTISGIIYQTIETKTIMGGNVTILAQSQVLGTISRVTADTLTEIVTPIVGLDSITNPASSSGGSTVESDQEYRIRIVESAGFVKNSGALPYMSIKLEEEAFINSVYVRENNLPTPQNGLPANSLAFTVLGGTDNQVAEAIYKIKPAGVKTFGSITVSVPTGFGDSQPISFSRPSYIDIYAKIEIETDSFWDPANSRVLKSAIVEYIGGVDTYTEDGEPVTVEYNGLGIGKSVIAWQAFGFIPKLSGIINLTLSFGTSPSTINQLSIPIANDQIPRIVTANVQLVEL